MPRRKKVVEVEKLSPIRKLNWGSIALVAIFVVSVISAVFSVFAPAYSFTSQAWLLLAIFGAYIAIKNIQVKEEISFLIGITAFVLIAYVVGQFGGNLLANFLLNMIIGFGAAGLLIALGLIIRLGWRY